MTSFYNITRQQCGRNVHDIIFDERKIFTETSEWDERINHTTHPVGSTIQKWQFLFQKENCGQNEFGGLELWMTSTLYLNFNKCSNYNKRIKFVHIHNMPISWISLLFPSKWLLVLTKLTCQALTVNLELKPFNEAIGVAFIAFHEV